MFFNLQKPGSGMIVGLFLWGGGRRGVEYFDGQRLAVFRVVFLGVFNLPKPESGKIAGLFFVEGGARGGAEFFEIFVVWSLASVL